MNMKYVLYALIAIVLTILVIWLIKDYQARMIIHNANYECIYGDQYACEFISQLEKRGK